MINMTDSRKSPNQGSNARKLSVVRRKRRGESRKALCPHRKLERYPGLTLIGPNRPLPEFALASKRAA